MSDYAKDSKGWVEFKSLGIKKVKLRSYIANSARSLNHLNGLSYSKNRQLIIEQYNEGGLPRTQEYFNKQIDKFIQDEKNSN